MSNRNPRMIKHQGSTYVLDPKATASLRSQRTRKSIFQTMINTRSPGGGSPSSRKAPSFMDQMKQEWNRRKEEKKYKKEIKEMEKREKEEEAKRKKEEKAAFATLPSSITYRGRTYRLATKSASTRTAGRYWYGTEEAIEGYMHLPVDRSDEYGVQDILNRIVEKAQATEVPDHHVDSVLQVYEDEMYRNVPRPDFFLDDVKRSVEKALDAMIPEDHTLSSAEELAYKNIGDDYANEALFGLIGGSPEYNFQYDYADELESMTGMPADDAWAELNKAEESVDWPDFHEDVVYAYDQAHDAAATALDELIEEDAEYDEDEED